MVAQRGNLGYRERDEFSWFFSIFAVVFMGFYCWIWIGFHLAEFGLSAWHYVSADVGERFVIL